ncbi:MAG: type IV pilin protein [Bacilli bacterium]
MNNKKAFTLVELIATITILGVILLIAVPSYNKYVEKTKNKLIESYEKSAEDAAKAFVTDCIAKNVCSDGNKLSEYIKGSKITLETLRKYGFFKRDESLEKKINMKFDSSYVEIKVNSQINSETYSDLYQYTAGLIDVNNKQILVSSKDSNSSNNNSSNIEENEQGSSTNSSGLVLKDKENKIVEDKVFVGAENSYTIYISNYSEADKVDVVVSDNSVICDEIALARTIRCKIPLSDGENNVVITDSGDEVKIEEVKIETDILPPTITILDKSEEYTKMVEFKVSLKDNKKIGSYKVEPNICSESSKTDSEIELECSITENGTYKVTVEDSVGHIKNEEIIIKNITSEKPSIVFSPNSGSLGKSGSINIEYLSGLVDGNYIGFTSNYSVGYDLLDVNNNVVSSGAFTAKEAGNGNFSIVIGDNDCNGSACTGTYKLRISEIINKAGNKITNVESDQFKIDNTPPKVANITRGDNATAISCGEIDSSTGNRTCQVNFDGGLAGVPVTSELNFEVEDIGYSGAEKVYYRSDTTSDFQETTINQINEMKHKDFLGKTLNLYLEVVFADAAGNIDFTRNILKINFVKN